MKKAILLLLGAVAFCSSCKKDQKKGPVMPAKIYKLNFNISGFSQTISNSALKNVQSTALKTNATTGVNGYLDLLYYYVFHSDGTKGFVHSLIQDSTYSNFGNISDSLVAGAYTIMVAAGKPGLNSNLNTSEPGGATLNGTNFIYYQGSGSAYAQWKDTFYGQIDINVAGNSTQDLVLNRIVAQLQVHITDAIPASATSISIAVSQDDLTFLMYSQTPSTLTRQVYSNTIPAAAKGKTDYTFSNLIGNTATPVVVTINCYDATNKVLGSAVVTNVICQKNKRTILTGRLFGSDNNFTVSLNDTWAPPINGSF